MKNLVVEFRFSGRWWISENRRRTVFTVLRMLVKISRMELCGNFLFVLLPFFFCYIFGGVEIKRWGMSVDGARKWDDDCTYNFYEDDRVQSLVSQRHVVS